MRCEPGSFTDHRKPLTLQKKKELPRWPPLRFMLDAARYEKHAQEECPLGVLAVQSHDALCTCWTQGVRRSAAAALPQRSRSA